MTRFSVGGTVVDDAADVLRRQSPVIRDMLEDIGAGADGTVPIPLDGAMSRGAQALGDIIRMAEPAPVWNLAPLPESIPWGRALAAYQAAHLLALDHAWLMTAAGHVSIMMILCCKRFPLEDLVPWTELARVWPELRAHTSMHNTLLCVYTCGHFGILDRPTPAEIGVVDRMAQAVKGVLEACGTEGEVITFLEQTLRPGSFARASAAMRQVLADAVKGRADRRWDPVRALLVQGLVGLGLCEDALRVAEAAAEAPRQYFVFSEAFELLCSRKRAEQRGETQMQAWSALVRDYTPRAVLRFAYANLTPDLKADVQPHIDMAE